MIEYVDHLHEHFVDPVTIREGRYQVPRRPGYSSEMHAASLQRYAFPEGAEWSTRPVIGAEAEEVAVGDVQPAPR